MSTAFSKKGDDLEFQAAAYFQSQGYLVRRGVNLSVAAGTADATDIDLLAIRFNVPLTEERLIADCKDRRKPRPFERVLWTKGLASFSQATQAVVILRRAVWQAREFATQGGVEILEALEIERYFKNLKSRYRPYGDADPILSVQRDRSHDRMLAREDLKLRQMLVAGHPLTNLNRIIKTLSNTGTLARDDKASWFRRYVSFNAAVIAGVMLVRFAAESKWTQEKDWAAYAKKKLTFGDVAPQKALELAQLALDRSIPEGIPAPPYTGEMLELIKALISNPRIAARIPNALDYHLFDCLLSAEAPVSTSEVQEADREEVLRMARRILSALSYAAGTPRSLWERNQTQQKELAYAHNAETKA